jgi:hypothetical protein
MPEIYQIFTPKNHPRSQVFVQGNTRNCLIAIGCSWTRAWGWNDEYIDHNGVWQDDAEFLMNGSYAGRVRDHLGLDGMINLAVPGGSNQLQGRLLIDTIEQNRAQFDRVFVLWGITSHLRWELWSNAVYHPTKFTIGGEMPRQKEAERRWYLEHHYNESFELDRLSQQIVMTHAYLKHNNIDHLFFPAFTAYNQHNLSVDSVSSDNFYQKHNDQNDMLTAMCEHRGCLRPKQFISNPYNKDDNALLAELQQHNLISQLHHPSAQGHEFIANQLITNLNCRKP